MRLNLPFKVKDLVRINKYGRRSLNWADRGIGIIVEVRYPLSSSSKDEGIVYVQWADGRKPTPINTRWLIHEEIRNAKH
jgi:hypothetical protein